MSERALRPLPGGRRTVRGEIDTTSPHLPHDDRAVVSYHWLDEREVARQHRRLVRRQLDRAASDQGLGAVELRWFRESGDQRKVFATDDEPRGHTSREASFDGGSIVAVWLPEDADADFARPGVPGSMVAGYTTSRPDPAHLWIGIHADIRGHLTAAVVAHEVRHLAQALAGVDMDDPGIEDDANAYGVAFMRRAG